MLKLFLYCFKNFENLSKIFVRNSIYRRFKRICFRFSIFDGLDKFFFSIVVAHILTGFLGFFLLEEFSLPIFEYFIFYSAFNTYFYLASRKILGWKFFSYYWVLLMIGFFVSVLLAFVVHYAEEGCKDPVYSTFLFYSERDLSSLFQYLLKFLLDFKNIFENNSYSFCTPGGSSDPNTNIPPFKPFWMPKLKTISVFNHCLVSGSAVGGFTHLLTNNPRISIPVTVCFTAIQFVAEMSADQ